MIVAVVCNARLGDILEAHRLRRHADHVEQRDRTVAGERRTEMLQLIRGGNAVDADQRRHLPIVAGDPPDDAAECAPIVQLVAA